MHEPLSTIIPLSRSILHNNAINPFLPDQFLCKLFAVDLPITYFNGKKSLMLPPLDEFAVCLFAPFCVSLHLSFRAAACKLPVLLLCSQYYIPMDSSS